MNLVFTDEQKQSYSEDERMWINCLFRYLYGNMNTRMKNQDLMTNVYLANIQKINMIDGSTMRKVIHFIRNEILPVNAGKVARCFCLAVLPESYKKGCFWLDATSMGYKATKDVESIKNHIETLESRRDQIDKDIESAKLVVKALERMEK